MNYLGKAVIDNEVFNNKNFVITGTLSFIKRNELKEIIESYGGNITGTVSKNTTAVITGSDPGSKYNKALELGIEIWNEEKIKEYLN